MAFFFIHQHKKNSCSVKIVDPQSGCSAGLAVPQADHFAFGIGQRPVSGHLLNATSPYFSASATRKLLTVCWLSTSKGQNAGLVQDVVLS